MTPLDLLIRYPGPVVALSYVAATLVGGLIARTIARAFEWPRVIEAKLAEWGGQEMAELKSENKDLRNQLRMRKQIIANYQHGMKVVAAGLASIGDVEWGEG